MNIYILKTRGFETFAMLYELKKNEFAIIKKNKKKFY